MRERIDIESELTPDVIFAKLRAEAGWRHADDRQAFPYDPGSHKVFMRVKRNHFTASIYAMRNNSFAPVCVGAIEASGAGGSRVKAHFRFNWFTRLFIIVALGMLASMIVNVSDGKFERPSGFYSPTVEAMLYGLGSAALLSPFVVFAYGFMYYGFKLNNLQDVLRKIVERASSHSPTGAPPSAPSDSPPSP